VEETLEHVRLKLGAQITELVSVLDNEPQAGVAPVRPPVKVAQIMTRQIRETQLKPNNG
jgi:hypothetical protein